MRDPPTCPTDHAPRWMLSGRCSHFLSPLGVFLGPSGEEKNYKLAGSDQGQSQTVFSGSQNVGPGVGAAPVAVQPGLLRVPEALLHHIRQLRLRLQAEPQR